MSIINSKSFCQDFSFVLPSDRYTWTFRGIIILSHQKVHSKRFLYNHSHAGRHETKQCQYSHYFIYSSSPEPFSTNTLLSCRIIISCIRQQLITYGAIVNFCLIQMPKWIKKIWWGSWWKKLYGTFLIKKNYCVPENFNEPKDPWDHFYTFCTILMPLIKKTELFSLRSGWRHIFFLMS